MKKFQFFLLTILSFALISCEEDDTGTNSGNGSSIPTFIVIENTADANSTENYAISQMSFSSGVASVERLIDLNTAKFPYYFISDTRIDGDKLYIYNLVPGYSNQLVAFDINGKNLDTLPWATTDDERTWATFSSKFDAKNGYVYYIMGEISKNYNDWPGSYLCRYNLSTGEWAQMSNPSNFTLNQPEKKWDTEVGSWGSVHASDDGSYCVGSIYAWGTEGGSNHYDYDLVYRYYPANAESQRLERIGDAAVAVVGATKSNKYLYKNSDIINTETDDHMTLTELKYLGADYTGYHNENGLLKISNYYGADIYIYYQDIENDVQRLVVETDPEILFAQMDKSGQFIWFGIVGDEENILCKTHDLSEASEVDTVARYPKSVHSAMLK